MKKVAVLMGSDSDWPVAEKTVLQLRELGIPAECRVLSAHRTPDECVAFAKSARENGFGAVIAAAGMAAHLAGVLAAHTTLPVIGIPVQSGALNGQDALYSVAQMPPGVPVATVGINAARNAALLAAQILAVGDVALARRLAEHKENMRLAVLDRDAALRKKLKED
jgi:5-(carboxyamino)imidazole ribonucleotide mutase